jgi:hypothetical protein
MVTNQLTFQVYRIPNSHYRGGAGSRFQRWGHGCVLCTPLNYYELQGCEVALALIIFHLVDVDIYGYLTLLLYLSKKSIAYHRCHRHQEILHN